MPAAIGSASLPMTNATTRGDSGPGRWAAEAAVALTRSDWPALRTILEVLPEPWPMEAYQYNGILHAQAGRTVEAACAFEAAIQFSPKNGSLWNNLALARYQAQDFAGAADAARKAIDFAPDLADAHNHLGMALAAMGEVAAASDAYRKALSHQPEHPLVLNNLAKLALDQGDAKVAMPWAEAACKVAPRNASAWLHLGLTHERLGDLEHARQAFCSAQEADHNLPAAAEGLHRLDPVWWQPLSGRNLTLTRRSAQDIEFLRKTLTDTSFTQRFYRYAKPFPAGNEKLASEIEQARKLPPLTLGSIDWTIHDRTGRPVGLVSLAALEWAQRRAELLVGIPDPDLHAKSVALEASLLAIEFAFTKAGLEKVVSLVYGDNPKAQSNTLHLGFREEGLLRQHLKLADGQRLDLWQNGLMRDEAMANPQLAAWSKRLLGRAWGQARSASLSSD